MDPAEALPLLQLLGSYYGIWVLHAAARLEVADILSAGPQDAATLAARWQALEEPATRFLHALEACGVVRRTPDGRYGLTAAGHWLRRDRAGSQRGSALMAGEPAFFRAWAACADAVRSGRPSFATANGATFFAYLDARPELARCFHAGMAGFPEVNAQILKGYDFSAARCVMELGGGSGGLARAIVDAYPAVTAWVFDRPSIAAQYAAQEHDRLRWIPGDFLDHVPAGADTHLLRFVLSDWSDEDVLRIFGNSRRALPPDGRLLIIDNLQPPGNPAATALLDLSMLVLTGGRVRSAAEYEALLRRAGFTPLQALTTPVHATILVAAPGPG